MGITRKKKKTTTYKEQDPNKVKQYLSQLAEFFDYQHVYLDETGFDTYLFCPYARSPKGQPVKAQISGKKYQHLSLVVAQIGHKLQIDCTNGLSEHNEQYFFETWFEQCLLPVLDKQSVIILDNARFHRMGVLREMAQKLGHKILPLAPYSPELNPIEHTWANIKRYMRTTLPYCSNFTDPLMSYFYFN